MWQPQTAAGYTALKSIGFTAAAMMANRAEPGVLAPEKVAAFASSKLSWYVENAATDFYSAYHRWYPNRQPNWRFVEIQNLYRENPNNPAAFIRDPSLSDRAWLAKIRDRLREMVLAHQPFQPLFYNLADEAGIADLNAFWDFDFSPVSLAAMRQWLMSQYGTLDALNAEWDMQFSSWDAVTPIKTAEAVKMSGNNFAAWADGKEWMDVAFAHALAVGRDAVHAANPTALAGLEGGQKPGWGGYDYSKLSGVVDVMEPGLANIQLVHALNPNLRLLTTSFRDGPVEMHRIWRGLLDGARGIIIWDEKRQFVSDDGRLGDRGQRAAPHFQYLRKIGALLINSQEVASDVAILYSPASQHVQWLLDWRGRGDAWLTRDAEAEDRDDGTVRTAMYAYERSLEQLGFAPRYVSSGMIEDGVLRGRYRLLILPHSIALSDSEVEAIEDFSTHGIVIADTTPGLYDEHGRKRANSRLAALFNSGEAIEIAPGQLHMNDGDPRISVANEDVTRLGNFLTQMGISPELRVRDARGALRTNIAIHRYRHESVDLLALHREFLNQQAADDDEQIFVEFPQRVYIYDVRDGSFLGYRRVLPLKLDSIIPTVLALSPQPVAQPSFRQP